MNTLLKNYKYIVVGSGFFGSVIAERIANVLDRPVLVIEKRSHIGGNCYSEDHNETGIHYHKYGTHIFHTSNELVYNYIRKFTTFNNYVHQVLTTFNGKVYQMPINLETINSFFNVNLKPFEVQKFLQERINKDFAGTICNFEDKAISMMGRELYEAFIKGYTIKQWQKDPKEMPAEILTRLPFRTNYNESYYHSFWQGIPTGGYTEIFSKLLSNEKIRVVLNLDFFNIRHLINDDQIVIYSGPIDQYFDYKYGKLEYRTLKFEEEVVSYEDYQGTSVMNFANEEVPYTRIHEPRHLHPERTNNYHRNKSLIIREYSKLDDGTNPYYPIRDNKNSSLVLKYREESDKLHNVFISGRLGDYKYYDMHDTIRLALETFDNKIMNNDNK